MATERETSTLRRISAVMNHISAPRVVAVRGALTAHRRVRRDWRPSVTTIGSNRVVKNVARTPNRDSLINNFLGKARDFGIGSVGEWPGY